MSGTAHQITEILDRTIYYLILEREENDYAIITAIFF